MAANPRQVMRHSRQPNSLAQREGGDRARDWEGGFRGKKRHTARREYAELAKGQQAERERQAKRSGSLQRATDAGVGNDFRLHGRKHKRAARAAGCCYGKA